ncbi:MAG: carboxypeptidase regulatory-like domain-containing protein, partial [Pyrinomonadaceae bacterium]
TYHPAAINLRDAIVVRVDPGRDTGQVNVTLVERNSYAVSGGVVRQQDGSPWVGATVLLRNKDSEFSGSLIPGMGQRTTRTDGDGQWSFSNVTEGTYVLTALAPTTRPSRLPGADVADREQSFRESRQRFLVAQQDIVVAGADLAGISVPIAGPGSVTGVVKDETGAVLPSDLVIFVELVGGGSRPGPPLPVRVRPDGSFSFNGIQGGDMYLSFALPPDSKYAVVSVSADGVDLTRVPLRVVEGAEAGPVQVVITSGLGRLTGRVVSDQPGQGLSGLVVLLAPVEPEARRFRTAILSTRTSPDGTFAVSGAPGEYFVLVRRREELPPIITDEYFRSAAVNAPRVVLATNEQQRLDLRLP